MAAQYAIQQPAGYNNYIKKVAVVGVSESALPSDPTLS